MNRRVYIETSEQSVTALMNPVQERVDVVSASCITGRWDKLPACLFPDDVECTYDRSIRRFIEVYK